MGKVTKSEQKRGKKMTDLLTERRRSENNLKRTRSVRASLRLIGTRFLTHKNQDQSPGMRKSPSLSNLRDRRPVYYNGFPSSASEHFIKGPVETILKTPMLPPGVTQEERLSRYGYVNELSNPRSESRVSMHCASRSQVLRKIDYFRNKDVHQRKPVKISTPPSMVAPKAAALLQVPTKQSWGPRSISTEEPSALETKMGWFLHRKERDAVAHRPQNGFHRTSMRLSMSVGSRRKCNNVWSNSSSTSSMFSFLLNIVNPVGKNSITPKSRYEYLLTFG